jgi:hypothetical protein
LVDINGAFVFSTYPSIEHPICVHFHKNNLKEHHPFKSFPCWKNKEIITLRYDTNLSKISLLINLVDTGISIEGVPKGLSPAVSLSKNQSAKIIFLGWKKENYKFLPLKTKQFVFTIFMVQYWKKKKGILIDKNIFHKILSYLIY